MAASKKEIDDQARKEKCKSQLVFRETHFELEIKKLKEQKGKFLEEMSNLKAELSKKNNLHEEKIKMLEKQHQSRLKTMQVENENLQAMLEDLQAETENRYTERGEETQHVPSKFGTIYSEYKEKLEQQRLELTADKTRLETKCTELRLKVHDQKEKIKVLEERDLSLPLKRAQETIKEQSNMIDKKNREIETLKRGKKEATEKYLIQMNDNAVQKGSLEESNHKYELLEKALEREQASHKKTKIGLCEIQRIRSDLHKEIEDLQNSLAITEPECRKLKAKVVDLYGLQMQLKEGIQTCIAAMDKPKLLRNRLIKLKRRYIDGDESVTMTENTQDADEFEENQNPLPSLRIHNAKNLLEIEKEEARIHLKTTSKTTRLPPLLKEQKELQQQQLESLQKVKCTPLPPIHATKTHRRKTT